MTLHEELHEHLTEIDNHCRAMIKALLASKEAETDKTLFRCAHVVSYLIKMSKNLSEMRAWINLLPPGDSNDLDLEPETTEKTKQ